MTHADVVHGQAGENALSVSNEFCAQHPSYIPRALTLNQSREKALHVFENNVGNESQPSGIDAHDGRTKRCQRAGYAQHGSVAAQYDGQIAEFSEFRPGISPAAGAFPQRRGTAFVQENFRTGLTNHRDQSGQGSRQTLRWLHENGDF